MRLLIFFILLTIISCNKPEKLGKVEITELKDYENDDDFIPHDCSVQSDRLAKMVNIVIKANTLTISNNWTDGLTGYSIIFHLNSELEVTYASYNEWSDVVDGSSTIYTIDNVELKLNSNPFKSKKVIGYYVLNLNVNNKAGEILKKEGVKDVIRNQIFKGKFNTYCKK